MTRGPRDGGSSRSAHTESASRVNVTASAAAAATSAVMMRNTLTTIDPRKSIVAPTCRAALSGPRYGAGGVMRTITSALVVVCGLGLARPPAAYAQASAMPVSGKDVTGAVLQLGAQISL